jgi:hypothetical protein
MRALADSGNVDGANGDVPSSETGGFDASRPTIFPGAIRGPLARAPRSAPGAVLVVAATLGALQAIHSPTPESGLRGLRGFAAALVAWETFLGLWLISGALPVAARRVAIGCFSLFGIYAFYEALAGKADCGCFGQVRVNPWCTVVLDVSIVLALLFLAKPAAISSAPASRWASRRWPVAAALAIGLAAGIASAVLHPKFAVAANGLVTAHSGKLVLLEPHKWLHHQLPVLKDIVAQGSRKPLGKRLAVGQWIIMFYHASCEECQQTIPVYEALAQREMLSGKTPHVAFIRVPFDPASPVPPGLFDSRLALHGTLGASHQWFAATPIVVELRGGKVVAVVSERSAMRLTWMEAQQP